MARRLRRLDGRVAADGAAVRQALVDRHGELRDYCQAVGVDWAPLDLAEPIEFPGWQVPGELRRGFGPGDRCVLEPDGVVRRVR